jgi:hypothetical protein
MDPTPDVRRSPIAGRLAAVLLLTTCLTPLVIGAATPALADGGAGGPALVLADRVASTA